jgi:transcriptional regulator with XRE-family HTH domain
MAAKAFGELFKRLRVDKRITLRKFCLKNRYDPGNISKLERGRLAPPQSEDKLAEYARALGVPAGSAQEREFIDLGLACAGQIPDEIMSDEELVAHLPLFLRTVKGKKISQETLNELIEVIRRS